MIKVRRGSIEVEGISGEMDDNGWVLYISTREKYVSAQVIADTDQDETMVVLGPDERTLRVGGSYTEQELEDAEWTFIYLPGGFHCEASRGRYTTTLIGRKASGIHVSDMPKVPWGEIPPDEDE